MAAAAHKSTFHTLDEYLAGERRAVSRSEYFDGQIYAMAGGSPEHSAITVNLTIELGTQLRGKACRLFSSDMKLRTNPTGLFAYPDLAVVCGEPVYHDWHRDVLTNPKVIVEVLSRSTAGYDRGRKFFLYRQIQSFTDYLLLEQEEPRIDHYVRQPDDNWLLRTITGLDSQLDIVSIGCTLRLSDIYAGVSFDSVTDLSISHGEPDSGKA